MTTIRELIVKLGVDADRQAVERFDKALDGVKQTAVKTLELTAKLAVGLLGLGAAATMSAEELSKEATTIEQQAKLLGVTTERYQELRYAVRGYGIDVGDLADVYAQIAGKAKDAEGGNKDAQKSFKELGISVKDLKGLSPDGLMKLLAERGGQAADQMSWLATVSKIFGEEGARQFGPLLKDGAANFDALAKRAHELGLVMNGEALKAARAYGAESTLLKGTLGGLKQEVTLALMPTLLRGARAINRFLQANRPFIRGGIDRGVKLLNSALDRAVYLLEVIGNGDAAKGIERVGKVLLSVLAAGGAIKGANFLLTFFTLLKAALAGISVAGALVAAKIAYVIAYVTTLVLIFEDLLTYIRGGDSLFGRLLAHASKGQGIFGKLAKLLSQFGRTGQLVFKLLQRVAGVVFPFLWNKFKEKVAPIFDLLKLAWETVGEPVFGAVLDAAIALFTRFNDSLEFLLNNWSAVWAGMEAQFMEFVGSIQASALALYTKLDELLGGGLTEAITWTGDVATKTFDTLVSQVEAVLSKMRELLVSVGKFTGIDLLANIPTATSGPGDGTVARLGGAAARQAFGGIRDQASAAASTVSAAFGPTIFQITQQPGEDSAEFARRIDSTRRADDKKKARLLRSRAKGER